jgi:hypothetical protein
MRAQSLACDVCGAPLAFGTGQTIAICRYCYTTSRLVGGAAAVPGGATAVVKEVATDVGQQVVQMVIDGRRSEAIAFFARHAGVNQSEAQRSVDDVLGPHLMRLTRQAPMTVAGLLRTSAIFVGAPASMGTVGVVLVVAGHGWAWALATLGVLLAVLGAAFTVPHVISSFVMRFGRTGRACVTRLAVLRPNFNRGGSLVLVQFDVVPDDGSPAFHDDETLLVAEVSLPKLSPGNVLSVRYDRRRRRVFPTVPIEVVGRA